MDAPEVTGRHVLFLNWRDIRNPEGGGSEVYVQQMAAQVVARGGQATLLCAAHDHGQAEELTYDGVRILRRGGRHTVYLRAAWLYLAGALGVGRLSRRGVGRPDAIVDVCNGLPFLSPIYARKPVVALVHHVHREQWPVVLGRRLARLGWWIESRLAPRVYRRCQYVTVSEATRRDLASIGVNPRSIAVVHNGTPTLPVSSPVSRSAHPSAIVLGRLVPHKRVEIAMQAIAGLVPLFPTVRLTVAGQGWWEPRLRDIAAELGIADRVDFVGYVDDQQKRRLLSTAWVALTPSLKEGWGLTIVEAAACGTPTVAFRTAGGVAEALLDGKTGMLADSADDFTAKLRILLSDDDLRTGMGTAAQDHASSFTWEASGERFAALLAPQAQPLAIRVPVTEPVR